MNAVFKSMSNFENNSETGSKRSAEAASPEFRVDDPLWISGSDERSRTIAEMVVTAVLQAHGRR